jgi:pimeloyl-ACP methyl ester carboxylesterase
MPVLVFVHGWLLSSRLWDPLVRDLAGDVEPWVPDLPGCGTRPRPRGLWPTLPSYGRWLARESQARAGGRPIVLVGHSLGGSIVLHAAAHLGPQLAGLVQVACGGGVYQPRPFQRLRRVGRLAVLARPTALGHWPLLRSVAGPLRADRRTALGLLISSTTERAVRQLPALVGHLEVPSLWIVGSRDQVMDPRYVRHLAGYARSPKVALLEGASHLPMRRRSEEMADLIRGWLQELQAPPAPPVRAAA